MSIADNVKKVQQSIIDAAVAAGRDPAGITLVAASKTQTPEIIREAFAGGIQVFGENRVQELTANNAAGAYEGAKLHFIGHLQTNKVKQIVGVVDLIESCGSLHLAQAISAQAVKKGITQHILVEVNIGREAEKSGIMPEEVDELLPQIAMLPGIFIDGLMTIAPKPENSTSNRKYFQDMYRIYIDNAKKSCNNISLEILSMGMSADYAEAIACGAYMVRVGTAIFGPRAYPAAT